MKNKKSTCWRNYEEVAIHLLNKFSDEFGINFVSGKEKIKGNSGVFWEIDAVAISDEQKTIIIECRMYNNRKLNQEALAGIAYRIKDTNSAAGIIVTPAGLQSGAKKLANFENIIEVNLNDEATVENYILSTVKKTFLGITEELKLEFEESLEIIVKDVDGNIIDNIKPDII